LMPPVACARAAHRDSGDRLKENNMAHGPVLDTRLLLDGFGMGESPRWHEGRTDACRDHFTAGQGDRMNQMFALYRAGK
jgi:hypothetical protein